MIKYIVVGILVALLVFIFKTANYVGAFKDVKIEMSDEPAKKLIFKTHIGAYHKIVPVIEQVEAWAKDKNIDCHLSFGEYLDNPDIAEEDRLKSHGGCVVNEYPNDLPADFERKEIPAQRFVKAEFEGSPGIGPLKVYPKVQAFADEQRIKLQGAVLEVYEIHPSRPGEPTPKNNMTTTYFFFVN